MGEIEYKMLPDDEEGEVMVGKKACNCRPSLLSVSRARPHATLTTRIWPMSRPKRVFTMLPRPSLYKAPTMTGSCGLLDRFHAVANYYHPITTAVDVLFCPYLGDAYSLSVPQICAALGLDCR